MANPMAMAAACCCKKTVCSFYPLPEQWTATSSSITNCPGCRGANDAAGTQAEIYTGDFNGTATVTFTGQGSEGSTQCCGWNCDTRDTSISTMTARVSGGLSPDGCTMEGATDSQLAMTLNYDGTNYYWQVYIWGLSTARWFSFYGEATVTDPSQPFTVTNTAPSCDGPAYPPYQCGRTDDGLTMFWIATGGSITFSPVT